MRLDLFSAEVRQNPYPAYDQLRRFGPVYHDQEQDLWLVGRYADVTHILSNPQIFSSQDTAADTTLSGTDGTVHKRARNIVRRAFTPARINALEGLIRSYLQDFVARVSHRNEIDLIDDLALGLPIAVIAEIFGTGAERTEDLRRWAAALVSLGDDLISDEDRARFVNEMRDWQLFLSQHIAQAVRHGSGCFASFLDRREHDRFTIQEAHRIAFVLLIAGTETTTRLIGNAAILLARDAALQRHIRANPQLIAPFIEEVLRYESPIQRRYRVAKQSAEIGGFTVPEGARLQILFGSANRDPDVFSEANQFRTERNPNRHVAFGGGPHFCPGSQLGKLEASIALETLTQRLPPFVLARPREPIRYGTLITTRGPTRLDLAFAPSFAEA